MIRRFARPVGRGALRGRLRGVGGWLPGALTLGNMFAGYAAILAASEDRFLVAWWLVFAATVLDGLDGRVARLTGTTSLFGAELDSLCDAISFAAAPSLLAFHMGLGSLGRTGWAVCFLFAACGVIRLARFSVDTVSHRDFIGLPSPTAAALAAVPALITHGEPVPAVWIPLYAFVVLGAALLMVSKVRYPAFKSLSFGPHPYRVLAIWAAILAGLLAFVEWMMPALILAYVLLPLGRYVADALGPRRDDGTVEESADDRPADSRAAVEGDR